MSRRLEREKQTVSAMIRLYCRQKHNDNGEYASLCRHCAELEVYAHHQVDHCRYGDSKPSCGQCTTPCYTPEKREAIREVMRTTRVKMLYYHPILTFFHMRDYVRFGKKADDLHQKRED